MSLLTPYGRGTALAISGGMAAAAALLAAGAAFLTRAPGAARAAFAAIAAADLLAAGFVLWFFRDPERAAPEGEGLLLAPADGKVTAVDEVEEPAYLGGRVRRVSIFLSILDVHINRAPCAGTVEKVAYTRGRFLNALKERSALENERNLVGLGRTPFGRVAIAQIAGLIARRIVCRLAPGQRVAAGESFGMLKFGSRTDLYLPLDAPVELAVRPGDRVRAGVTVIGRKRP